MPATRVFLGIGSNLGDRAANIKSACDSLLLLLSDIEQASLYETLPQEVIDQPPFLNTVVTGRTAIEPAELLTETAEIERRLGRERSRELPKGPRTIDIDLLLFGEQQIETDNLVVPHPRMTARKFVLVPLLELAPELRHPSTGLPFQGYLESLGPQGIYYFSASGYSRGISEHRHHDG